MNDIPFRPIEERLKARPVIAVNGQRFTGVSGLRNFEKVEAEKELLKVPK